MSKPFPFRSSEKPVGFRSPDTGVFVAGVVPESPHKRGLSFMFNLQFLLPLVVLFKKYIYIQNVVKVKKL